MKKISTGILFGFIGGFLTLLFGGWSVAVIGCLMGVGLGMTLSGSLERKDPIKIAISVLPTALVAGIILIATSLFQNYSVQHAIGKHPTPTYIVIYANIIGFLGALIFTTLLSALHGLPEKQEQRYKMIMLAILIIAFPFIDKLTSLRWTAQIIFALIFVLLGLGLNIVVGYAGLLDLGYAAFFAIGAYTTGILSSPQHGIYMNFWLVIWLAAGMAALWGLMLGAPTLGLRGDYLAIVTLGFGEIVPVLFKNLIDVTVKEPISCWVLPGINNLMSINVTMKCITLMEHVDLTAGEKGISPIGRPYLPFVGMFKSSDPIPWYFLMIGIIILSVFIMRRLRVSRLGRAWMALREDELASAQMGIDPVKTKLAAFAIGATFSGFAGAFYASYIAGIFPSVFDFSMSIIILSCIILGGIGNINGVIVGGLVLMTADRLFLPALKDFLASLLTHTILPAISNPVVQNAVKDNANPILYRFLLFGFTLVFMMSIRPEGLIPNTQVRAELHPEDLLPVSEADASKVQISGKE